MTARSKIGDILIDGVHWGYVEWSDKRQEWCIEDTAGRCLTHASDLRGTAASQRAAVELAKAMIRDGRMPSPEQAVVLRQAELAKRREKRAKQPSEIRRQQERAEQHQRYQELSRERSDANWQERHQPPLYEALCEALCEAFDFSDPDLWRSNSFASLRPRLVIWMRDIVADLALSLHMLARDVRAGQEPEWFKRRVEELARAREILGWLEGDPQVRSEAAE